MKFFFYTVHILVEKSEKWGNNVHRIKKEIYKISRRMELYTKKAAKSRDNKEAPKNKIKKRATGRRIPKGKCIYLIHY